MIFTLTKKNKWINKNISKKLVVLFKYFPDEGKWAAAKRSYTLATSGRLSASRSGKESATELL